MFCYFSSLLTPIYQYLMRIDNLPALAIKLSILKLNNRKATNVAFYTYIDIPINTINITFILLVLILLLLVLLMYLQSH